MSPGDRPGEATRTFGIMRLAVEFQSERVEFDVPDERVVGSWSGPASIPTAEVGGRVLEALGDPRGYPPLRQAVVPGDRVVIALDPETPELGAVLGASCEVLRSAGVEPETTRVLAPAPPPGGWPFGLPSGVEWSVHDPEDRAGIAYLATTPQGRRVYLNRHATDADFVLAIGRFGFDAALGFRGPWSAIYPDLSDAATLGAYRGQGRDDRTRWDERETLAESAEVSWLLGGQLQLGVLEGASGLAGVVAGVGPRCRPRGIACWKPPGRSDPSGAPSSSSSASAGRAAWRAWTPWPTGSRRPRVWCAEGAGSWRCRGPSASSARR
jgi:hypothetical protein